MTKPNGYMDPARLRLWMRRYGNAGVLAVGIYLALHWLCSNPRSRAVLFLMVVLATTACAFLVFTPVIRCEHPAPVAPVIVDEAPGTSMPTDNESSPAPCKIDMIAEFGKAAEKGDIATVRRLLKEGVPIESGTDETDTTALGRAASGGHTEVVRFLLSHGADVRAHTEEGTSVLMDAIVGNNPDCVRLLLHQGADIREFGRFDSPLTCAIRNGGLPMVKLLVRAGADLHDGGFYSSPLEEATECGDTAIIRFLLDRGVDVDEGCRWDRTPLMRAAKCGNAKVVRLLIERGADFNAVGTLEIENSHRLESPLALAEQNGHRNIVGMLRRAGARRQFHQLQHTE